MKCENIAGPEKVLFLEHDAAMGGIFMLHVVGVCRKGKLSLMAHRSKRNLQPTKSLNSFLPSRPTAVLSLNTRMPWS